MNAASALPLASPPPPSDRAAADTKPTSATETAWFGDDGLTFDDVLDVLNPLHHLPIVGTIYRNLTEDRIDAAPRVMGGTLYGGPIGFVASLFNTVVEAETGRDAAEHAYAFLTGEDETEPPSPEAEFDTAAGRPPADDFALVSEWARRELAHRQQLAAARSPNATAATELSRLAPSSRPRNEAGLGTALFAQALRGAPGADPASATGPAARATPFDPGPEPPSPQPSDDALDARLRALSAHNPWTAGGNDGQAEADGWFAQSLMDGLERYQGGQPGG